MKNSGMGEFTLVLRVRSAFCHVDDDENLLPIKQIIY